LSSDSTQDKAKLPVLINKPLNWANMGLTQQARTVRFVEDEEGNIWAYPVVLIDPQANTENLTVMPNVVIRDPNIAQFANVDQYTRADLSTLYNSGALLNVNAVQCVYNSLGTGSQPRYETLRTPNKWKNASTAVAPATTDLWTPAGGTKFRVLGGTITMSGTIAAAAIRTLTLIEETAATVIARAVLDIPILGGTLAYSFTLGPNGFLASTVDKKLQIVTAGATYVTGADAVMVWGTEE
jgi:hypothetical protein